MKIGITFNMDVAVWANGMQQNIVFLYSLFKKLGHRCYYITAKEPKANIHKDHEGMLLEDLLEDETESLDVLIVAGFDLLPDMYKALKRRNSRLKIILIHYGNKLMDDMHHGICGSPSSSRRPVKKPALLDQIWTSPHYEFAKSYIQSYYHHEDVRICPYIWDPFFVNIKVESLKDKGFDLKFNQGLANKICVFEPNKTHSKNCLIPVMACERFNQLFPGELDSVNVFCCENIRDRNFFKSFIRELSIGKKENFMFFNNRWGAMEACAKFGHTVISHQMYNELNYSHLEKLYLGLPLIHNSNMMQDVGYYYPEFDVDMAAKQIKSVIKNHGNQLESYKEDAGKYFRKFSLENQDNLNSYQKLLNE